MYKITLAIWFPALVGSALLLVAYINIQQFATGSIEVRVMLVREIPLVLLGLAASLVLAGFTVFWLFCKQWKRAVQSVLSIVFYLVCFTIGGANGAAYLNAT